MEFRKGVRYVAELMEPTNGDIYLCGDNDSDGSSNGNVVVAVDDVRSDDEANDKERIVHATALSGVGGGGIPGGCGLFAFCGNICIPKHTHTLLFHTALYYSLALEFSFLIHCPISHSHSLLFILLQFPIHHPTHS